MGDFEDREWGFLAADICVALVVGTIVAVICSLMITLVIILSLHYVGWAILAFIFAMFVASWRLKRAQDEPAKFIGNRPPDPGRKKEELK